MPLRVTGITLLPASRVAAAETMCHPASTSMTAVTSSFSKAVVVSVVTVETWACPPLGVAVTLLLALAGVSVFTRVS